MTPRGGGFHTIAGFVKRTPFETQLDVQASHALTLGGRKVTLIADAFNVFNARGRPAVPGTCSLRLGARVAW